MKDTHTFFKRAISAGICLFALAVLMIFTWAAEEERKPECVLIKRTAEAAQMLGEDVTVNRYDTTGRDFFPCLYERLREICGNHSGTQVVCYVDGETNAEGLARVEIGDPGAKSIHYLYLKQDGIVYEICGNMSEENWNRYLSMVFLEESLWLGDKQLTGLVFNHRNFDFTYDEGTEGLTTIAVYSFGSYEADPESYEISKNEFIHVRRRLWGGYEQVEETVAHPSQELPCDGDEELLAYLLERYPHMERCRIYPAQDSGIQYYGVKDEYAIKDYYCIVEEKEISHVFLCLKGKTYEISSVERNGGTPAMPFAMRNDRYYADSPRGVWEKGKEGNSVWRNAEKGSYELRMDMGEEPNVLIQFLPAEWSGSDREDKQQIYDVKVFREGETEPIQEFQTGTVRQEEYSVWQDGFSFRDFNGDRYTDLSYSGSWNGSEKGSVRWLWSPSQQKFIQAPEELKNCVLYFTDKENRRMRATGSSDSDGNYSDYTYQWTGEMDCEMIKSISSKETEKGVDVCIMSFHDGSGQVLMDCQYDLDQYWYDAGRYWQEGIFWDFYTDDIIWEKTIREEASGAAYTLYYAQEIQYDEYEEEKSEVYEGHLWVTDETTRLVKRLYWQSEVPFASIIWKDKAESTEKLSGGTPEETTEEITKETPEETTGEASEETPEETTGKASEGMPEEPALFILYEDGSEKVCTLSEILADPVQAVYEKSKQIDYQIREYSMDSGKYDTRTDAVYKDAYYQAISSQVPVRDLDGREVYLKGYWFYQGDTAMEMANEEFLENIIRDTQFYYMDFDGDGLPELVMDIMGDGLHVLKYLPEEDVVEIFFGYERMPYFNLLGAGQLYYHNPTLASKDLWEYDLVDKNGQDRLVVYLQENYKYNEQNSEWEGIYWVHLDEELGLVRVPEEIYEEMTKGFFDAVAHALPAMTFEEVFGAL